MRSPCDGIRVIDFSNSYPGALATMILADAGAEVIKVEPPGGDPSRSHYASLMWHRGKKSVVLDLKMDDDLVEARSLCNGADAVLETFRPGVADRVGIGYDSLKTLNPAIVYNSITGFGPKGPFANVKGYEGVVAAAVGRFAAFDGMVEKDGPIYAAQWLGSYAAAMLTVQGMVAALRVRDLSGQGQKVETSLLQAFTCFDLHSWLAYQLSQRGDPVAVTPIPAGPIPAYMPARAKDGRWMQMANLTVATQWNFLNSLGLTHLLEDPRYEAMPGFTNAEDQDAVHRICLKGMREKSADEWLEIFMKNDIAGEPFRHTQEGLSHEQIVHNGNIVECEDPIAGIVKQLGPLAKFEKTPVGPKGPAPVVGQNMDELPALLARVKKGVGGDEVPMKQPLDGVTVLEFASYIAVPFTTCLLADMGARVIKVEPITGDLFRSSFPRMCKTLLGKEDLALDLKDGRSQEAIHALVKKADILVHNFRPGVPERLGIDYATVKMINPRLIYLYVGAYGSTGPHSHRTGFHPIAGAITGGPRLQVGKRLPPPISETMSLDEIHAVSVSMRIANESNPDPVTALASATTLMMALYDRERTGEGQYIEGSMMGCNLYAHADDALAYEGKPERVLPDMDYEGLHALYRMYQTAHGRVFLACPSEEEWGVLANTLNVPDLGEDARFRTHEVRLEHDDALIKILQEVFLGKMAIEWQEILTRNNVACVVVYEGDMGKFLGTVPFVREEGLMRQAQHDSLGEFWRPAPPHRFSSTPGVAGTNIFLGEHTRSILTELGYTKAAIAKMETSGVALQSGSGIGTVG
ncbi:CoA transferase [Dehalococcoidia bacterium]|nr:CoA transferase [Dehalococcoidia bacterium]